MFWDDVLVVVNVVVAKAPYRRLMCKFEVISRARVPDGNFSVFTLNNHIVCTNGRFYTREALGSLRMTTAATRTPHNNRFKDGAYYFYCAYRIYSNKRRGAYLIFRATSAVLIRGRRLFKHCTRKIYFFYIFIQRYTFYLLIFLWTDTKLIVNLELREKFTRWKKPESFMITRAKISAVRANSFVVLEQFIVFFLVIRNSSNKRRIGGAALINFYVPDAALIRGRRLFE